MKRVFTDQMGWNVEIEYPPKRIVSLVPSQTELLFHLSLDEEVAGLTKFCIHPADKWREKPRIGGTKNLNLPKIESLHPDLVIGNKEENDQGQIETLKKKFPIWMSDIESLGDALDMVISVSEMVGKKVEGQKLAAAIKTSFVNLPKVSQPPKTAYLIWRKPWMAVGCKTFIDNMLATAGFENVFADKSRYPEIALEDLSKAGPEVIMLSSEPYPFTGKHVDEVRKHCPSAIVKLVDGEMFSWYGSRLLKAAPYFRAMQKELNLDLLT